MIQLYIEALQYVTCTCPDISYVVHHVCVFMNDPRVSHFQALKRIMKYLKGTLTHGLHIRCLVVDRLVSYRNVYWVGCPTTRQYTSSFCVYLGNGLFFWSSKYQHVISWSSVEVEYQHVANVLAETTCLRNLLLELYCPRSRATIVLCDNVSSMYLSSNPV